MNKMETRRNLTLVSYVLNLIYPPICGICGKFDANFLCKRCEKQLESQAKFRIEKKANKNYYFQEHLYIFEYQGIIRKILLNYKFNDRAYLYKTITNFLLKNKKIFPFFKSYDTIVPVPISKKRKKERGYNQSALIAKEIARNIEIEYNKQSLYKKKNIIEQSKLNKEQRQINIQGVYELYNHKKIKNKKILLVDDIYTTGSTVNECCRILSQAQPKKIGILTLAKD
jgi:competence protein ComFC